jgi:hypothetical protein
MPNYTWRGLDRRRKSISGQLTAANKEGVLASLKAAGVQVTSIDEIGAMDVGHRGAPSVESRWGPKRSLSLAFFSLAAFVTGWLFSTLQPVDIFHCDGERRCSIEHWVVGDSDHHRQELTGVDSAPAESSEEIQNGGSRRPDLVIQRTAVSFHNAKTRIAGDPVLQPVPATSEAIAERLQGFLARPSAGGITAWQGELGPVASAGFFAVLGLVLGTLAFRAWRSDG